MDEYTQGRWKLWHNDKGAFVISDNNGAIIVKRNDWDHRAAESIANAHLIWAAADLFEAALRLEMAELAHANCEECEGEGVPECCEVCFPLFDDARVMRRNAIAKARGTPITSAESAS